MTHDVRPALPVAGASGPDYAVGRQFQMQLIKHTGLLVAYQQQTYTIVGTLEQCERAYRDARDHCLAAGWWSLLSALLMNWIALSSNKGAIEQVRKLAAQPNSVIGTRAGWYGDPAGTAAQRYWDGAAWTQWTYPPVAGFAR
jgi:hypothetical protein